MALSPVIIIAQVHGRALTSPRRQAAAWTRGLIAGVHKSPIQQFQSGMDAVMVVWTFRSGREHDVAGGLRVHLLLLPGPTASSSSCISGPTEAVRLCGAASLRACGLSPCSRWRTRSPAHQNGHGKLGQPGLSSSSLSTLCSRCTSLPARLGLRLRYRRYHRRQPGTATTTTRTTRATRAPPAPPAPPALTTHARTPARPLSRLLAWLLRPAVCYRPRSCLLLHASPVKWGPSTPRLHFGEIAHFQRLHPVATSTLPLLSVPSFSRQPAP
jgi:hypothetical protein